MNDNKTWLIGISGTNGAGKDTIGHILASEYGYLFYSVTDLLREECRRRNLPVERENLRMISTEWRTKYGTGVLVDKAIEEFNKQKDKYKGLAVASLRNLGEVYKVHEKNGLVAWIDAEPMIRYQRVQANAATRNRSEEDSKSFEQFIEEEKAEQYSNGDPNKLGTMELKEKCDIFIDNDEDDQSLKAKIAKQIFNL